MSYSESHILCLFSHLYIPFNFLPGALWYARSQSLARKLALSDEDEELADNSGDEGGEMSEEQMQWLFALGGKCVCEALAVQFVAPGDRTTELTVRGLDLHSQQDSGRIEVISVWFRAFWM